MNERDLIRALTAKLPVNQNTIVPAGDDCAAIGGFDGNSSLLLKTDAIVEGVHFTRSDSPELVGRKALARCLSDIAAMGGEADSALVSIGFPNEESVEFLEKAYDGMIELAEEFSVAVVGGETTRNPGGIFISVTLTGRAKLDGGIKRSGARAGDAIFVSGELGGSLAGHHLEFVPRVREARWLVAHFEVQSMIDLSDGIATDLGHLIEMSGVGAMIDESFLPISRAARNRSRENEAAKSPLLAALTDGEDFELLFTLAPRDAVKLKDTWREAFPDVPLSLIGRIEAEPGLRLKQADRIRSLGGVDGYDHFQ